MKQKREREKSPDIKQLYVSVLLAAAAFVSLAAASVAWFTIADFTKVHSMSMEITAGTNLRFDLDAHESFEEYVKTLSFAQIAERISAQQGYDIRQSALKPVTTKDCRTFSFENGTEAEKTSGDYLEFVLHFMATEDMLVHLSSDSSPGRQDGTKVSSSNSKLPAAMRIGFSVEGVNYVYDPGLGDDRITQNGLQIFGLAGADEMTLSEKNQMFWLKKNVDQPVTVRIWLEGSDPDCTDAIRKADYSISLRFVGTDRDHRILDGATHTQREE